MATIALPPTLTMGDARAALARLQQAIADDPAPVLDGSALQTLDTAAIAVLLDCQRSAAAAGKTLQVIGLPAKLRALASLYGVDALITR